MKGKKCEAGPRLTPADISQQRVSQIQEGGQQGDITASLHCSSKYWVAIRWEEGKRLSNTQKLTPRDTSLQPGNKKRFNFFLHAHQCKGNREVTRRLSREAGSVWRGDKSALTSDFRNCPLGSERTVLWFCHCFPWGHLFWRLKQVLFPTVVYLLSAGTSKEAKSSCARVWGTKVTCISTGRTCHAQAQGLSGFQWPLVLAFTLSAKSIK